MEKNFWTRLLSGVVTSAVMAQALPVMSIAQIYAEDRAAEEALRNELLSYTEDYPEGAIAFYEESTTIKEGDSDKEVTIVRLGDPSEAMSVDVKAYDVTAQYGADYTLYTKIKRKKNYADDSQATAPKVQAAMEDGTFKDMLAQDGEAANTDSVTGEPVAPTEELPPVETPAEETAEDDSEYEIVEAQAAEQAETEQSSGEEAEDSMRGAFRQQTGKDTVNTNWRGEYEQEQLEKAAMEADNEVVDSFDGAFLTLDFEPGEYKKTVYVHIEDDDKGEITESTALVLGNATLGVIGVNMQYTVNIEDNEPDEPVTFAMKEAEIVTDRSASYAEVTVERVTGMDYYASLNWRTASGTAESMDAYIPVDNGNVSFAPGQTEATVRVELTEAAQVGTYFTVLIDEDKNITEEKRKSTKVWIGSTKANGADVLEEPDMFPQPQPLPKPSLPAAVSAPIVNASSGNNKNVVYSVPSSVLSTPKYTSQGKNFNIPELKGARFVRVEVKATDIYRTSALDVYAGNELIGWKVVDKPRYSFEEVNVSGLFALKSTDCTSLRLTADFWYDVTAIQIYYPSEYTFITLNEEQTLTGKKYTSTTDSTDIKVPAIPNWKSSFANEFVTVSKTTPKKQLQNFSSRLQNGVKVESAEAYIGKPEEHEYIKDIKIFYVYNVSWENEMKIMQGEYTYEGYSIVSNWEMTYDDVMLGIKTTKNPSEAIKDIHIFTGLKGYRYDSYSYEKVIRAGDKITYLNRNYEPVPSNKDQQDTDTRFGKISSPISTEDALFLYYTREDDGSGYSLSTLKRWEEKDSSYVPVAEIGKRHYNDNKPFKNLSFTKFRSNYLGTITGIKDGYLDYNSMSMICSNAAQMDALNANNNTIYLIPKYTTEDAEVSFKAEDSNAVSFSGNKESKGFKNGNVLKCKMIDQVEMAVLDVTKGQEVKPANILRESYYGVNNRSKTTKNVFAVNSTTSSRLSATVNVDYPKEVFTALYNRPTLTIKYDADENAESKPSRKFGDVMLSAFNEPSKILGHSNYLEPFTYKARDLSMLHSSYLLSAQIDDSKMHQILYDKAGLEYQMSTRTIWTFRDKNTGEDKTLTGNSMVFKPYYGNETVEYFFEQREDNAKPVGISGKVYTLEKPLFAVEGTESEKKEAVGVTLNIGGYNTYTDAKGQYSIGQFFNKGDHVAGYAQYNSLSEVMDIGISKDTVYNFVLDVNGLDGIRVKSSSMQKKAVVNKGSLPFGIASGADQYNYAVQDESIMTQEDAEYYLHLSVESDVGIVPDYAEFRVYSKNGDLRPDLTKQVKFINNSLTYTVNPMSMSDSKKLEVGDTFTVTLYDTKGNKYYEHHTDILVAEALNGMYMFNYKGKEHDDNDAFLNAMGNISIAYDLAFNMLSANSSNYTKDGKKHHLVTIGFGENMKGADIYNTEQNVFKMLDDMKNNNFIVNDSTPLSFMGGSSGTKEEESDQKKDDDAVKPTNSSAFNFRIQLAMVLDVIQDTDSEDTTKRGKYYFSDFLIVAGCTVDFKKVWTFPIGAAQLKITLGFSLGKLNDGLGSGVRWHFYTNPANTERKYITEDSAVSLMKWDGTNSVGDLGFNATIGAGVDFGLDGIITVGGRLDVNLINNVYYSTNNATNDAKNKGWNDTGSVALKPNVHLKISFLTIPLWSTRYQWNWGDATQKNAPPAPKRLTHPPTDDEIQTDILFNKTSDREILDYSELYGERSEWGGSRFLQYAPGKPSSAQDITEKVLQNGFYDNTDISVTDLGNGKYLATFIDLVPDRATPDAFGAYYSVYNGTTWSVPQLLEDDGTADDVPTVCNAGSKGWLIVWSDASRLLDENENVGDMLNTYDLTGRFFDPETNKLGDVMEITKTGGTDTVCDSAPEISYYEENGQEFMKIYYTKSEYEVSSEEDGEVIGDLLNPYELKAVRNYDFENDTWAEDYYGSVKEKLVNTLGDNYDSYVQKWYGQEFLDLAPALTVTEQVDELGYWKDGTTATVTEADHSQAMAKDSAVITYNHLSLQAYTLDKGGMAQEDHDENLYMQIYNYHDDEYHHPILISGKNADISDLQFIRTSVQTDNGLADATYLYWLEDSYIKRINISSLVKNSLAEGKTAAGQSYYYIDKSLDSAFMPEQIIAAPTFSIDDNGNESMERCITSFKVKQNGDYIYILWTEFNQQDENGESKNREQQLYAIRENTATGERTYPVQITEKSNQDIHRFDFVVDDNGELDVLADRMMFDENGDPEISTSELVAFHFKPSDKLVISEISDASIAMNEKGELAAKMNVTLENRSFNTQQNIVIDVQDEEGNVVYTSNKPLVSYAGSEALLEDGSISFDQLTGTEIPMNQSMIGGQELPVMIKIPMNQDGSYAGKIVLYADGNMIETIEKSGTLHPELTAEHFTATASDRNEVTLQATIKNNNYLPSGNETVSYGYVDAEGNKTALGTTSLSALRLDQQTTISNIEQVDFSTFASRFEEDGTLTDSMEFYLECENFKTAYCTLDLTATANEYELMTGLKDFDAKPSIYNRDGSIAVPEAFNPGDKAYMNLWIADDFAQNQEDYTNRTKIVWTESSDNVASVTRDGIVTANGAGTTTLKGFVVPRDTESILYDDGTSQTIDNYIYKPSAVVIPITANVIVGDGSTVQTGNIATDEEILSWAASDYMTKNEKTVSVKTLNVSDEGKYEITLFDENYEVLDKYVIDPKTGTGVNSANEEVNLPQTGTNSMKNWLIIFGAFMLIGFGLLAVRFSGFIRRKEDED